MIFSRNICFIVVIVAVVIVVVVIVVVVIVAAVIVAVVIVVVIGNRRQFKKPFSFTGSVRFIHSFIDKLRIILRTEKERKKSYFFFSFEDEELFRKVGFSSKVSKQQQQRQQRQQRQHRQQEGEKDRRSVNDNSQLSIQKLCSRKSKFEGDRNRWRRINQWKKSLRRNQIFSFQKLAIKFRWVLFVLSWGPDFLELFSSDYSGSNYNSLKQSLATYENTFIPMLV